MSGYKPKTSLQVRALVAPLCARPRLRSVPPHSRSVRGAALLQLYRDCMRLVKHLAGTSVRVGRSGRAAAGGVHSFAAFCTSIDYHSPLVPLGLGPPQSVKAIQLRKIVSEQFRVNRDEVDPARIHVMKQM